MERKSPYIFLASLLSFAFLVACGPSQAEIDATSTQMAGDIFSTQTAQVPTATKTPTPSPTLTNTPTPTNPPTAFPTSLPTETPQVVRYDIPVDDDPAIGPEDAPITIIEFSDYECHFCQQWHTEVFTRLLQAYPEQVRLVYRDFPLSSIHPNAIPAALAANCALEQDVFWDYHDKLFGMELGLSTEAYQEYASQLGLDTEEFAECLDSVRYQEEVQADFNFAANVGVRSTPTFFVNGIAIVGAQPFEVFQEVIERELAGEIP